MWGIPYESAKSRNHPHQRAIGAATWVSLFTLGVLWPFLWIWAMAYRIVMEFADHPQHQRQVGHRTDLLNGHGHEAPPLQGFPEVPS